MNMFGPEPVHDSEAVLARLQALVAAAHATGAPVVLIRHNGPPGTEGEPGTSGWELHLALNPERAAVVIDKTSDNAFLRTNLSAWLVQNGVRRVVIGGMLTDYCIDSTVRAAHDLGYEVVLAADAHSTAANQVLSAPQIIAHHNIVLSGFAQVRPAAEIDFAAPETGLSIPNLTPGDLAAIQAGLAEWRVYERWLSQGEGAPYWPHTHPSMVADRLHQLWDPAFKLRPRYTDPPPWEMGVARTFIQPLIDTPMFVRKTAVQAVTKAFDHLLQNPRNPLSPHINKLTDDLYSYDARDIRLIYVPHVTTDPDGRERRVIFLLWAAPGVPERNPFAF